MSAPTTNQLLGDILGELRLIRGALCPEQPEYQLPQFQQKTSKQCARCGIDASAVAGYVCADPNCPSGACLTTSAAE